MHRGRPLFLPFSIYQKEAGRKKEADQRWSKFPFLFYYFHFGFRALFFIASCGKCHFVCFFRQERQKGALFDQNKTQARGGGGGGGSGCCRSSSFGQFLSLCNYDKERERQWELNFVRPHLLLLLLLLWRRRLWRREFIWNEKKPLIPFIVSNSQHAAEASKATNGMSVVSLFNRGVGISPSCISNNIHYSTFFLPVLQIKLG